MPADLRRPRAPLPYDRLPAVPSFVLTSEDMTDGARLEDRFSALHENISPELHWEGAPRGTRSFVVTCFDPDAPTPSGYWHWTIVDLAPEVASLPRGAGESDLHLDGAAFHVRNDASAHSWLGPCPPAGDGEHRYVFAVHALDIDTLGLDDEASPTAVAFHVAQHTLARALLTATYSVAGAPGAPEFIGAQK